MLCGEEWPGRVWQRTGTALLKGEWKPCSMLGLAGPQVAGKAAVTGPWSGGVKHKERPGGPPRRGSTCLRKESQVSRGKVSFYLENVSLSLALVWSDNVSEYTVRGGV